MMNVRRMLYGLCVAVLTCALGSCIGEEDIDDTPMGNFEALWTAMDQHYCFFDYKQQEYGLDWNQVKADYRRRITSNMNTMQLFEVLNEMLRELRDGHVNLFASHDVGRYWAWNENYPANFSDSLQRLYLGSDYRIASGIKYKILDDNIGYMYISTFENGFGGGNLAEIIHYLEGCNGLVIDIRNNGGGKLTAADDLAARFTETKVLAGYICHKTGPGHNDFSTPTATYIEPANGVRWQKKVAVLTNRRCYSSANYFVEKMKALPQVTIVGDRTGGGSGLPFSTELPNGWSVRFSACPMYDAEMNCTEMGIDPDVKVDISTDDWNKGRDTILETARQLLGNS